MTQRQKDEGLTSSPSPDDFCAQCGKVYGQPREGVPLGSTITWCGDVCHDAWMTAHPEEAKGWIKVEDLNAADRAELDWILAGGKGIGGVS